MEDSVEWTVEFTGKAKKQKERLPDNIKCAP